MSLDIESRLVVESTLSLSSVMYPFIYGSWEGMDGGLYSSTPPPGLFPNSPASRRRNTGQPTWKRKEYDIS